MNMSIKMRKEYGYQFEEWIWFSDEEGIGISRWGNIMIIKKREVYDYQDDEGLWLSR